MMIFDTVSAIQAHVKLGAVRGLAVTTTARSGVFPELPTISEAALKGYDASTWGGILAPAGTPKAIVDTLNAAINAALKMDDVKAKLGGAGIEIQGGSPADFAKVIAGEIDKWGKVVKDSGIQPE